MHFWKYCGAGNDFVILENFDGSIAPERYAALAAALCREHFSVGADGLMVLEPPAQGGDCRMRFYNRDGSTAEMCGNGARCLCRHCHDRGLASGPASFACTLRRRACAAPIWSWASLASRTPLC